ncbi:hypothetical protein MMC10_008617 [Thelotrema lepadinum]|nr:hypothetical protein [Thelotrema lepadinum]
MAKLYAIADLHLGHPLNATEWAKLPAYPQGSGLILAGDVGETTAHLTTAFTKAKACFTHVFWVPGNHELYTMPSASSSPDPADALQGEAKYHAFVSLAREHGVLTPEDPWMLWPPSPHPSSSSPSSSSPSSSSFPFPSPSSPSFSSLPPPSSAPPQPQSPSQPEPEKVIIALIFTLYDYSFRPPHIPLPRALSWAAEHDIEATDEHLLSPHPYASREAWCAALVTQFTRKFTATSLSHPHVPYVIVNHWPLREDLVYIPRIPRFSLWCGTKETEEWHRGGVFGEAYGGAKVVVTGHLHVRRTDWIEGCRFEECSLGYPRQWEGARERGLGVEGVVREIWPGPVEEEGGGRGGEERGTVWRRFG